LYNSRSGTYRYLIGKVEIRYSTTCGTNWTRVSVTDGVPRHLYGNVINMVHGWSTSYDLGYATSLYTDMVYAPNDLACSYGYAMYPYNQPDYDSAQACA
jgi:hypothetical protein